MAWGVMSESGKWGTRSAGKYRATVARHLPTPRILQRRAVAAQSEQAETAVTYAPFTREGAFSLPLTRQRVFLAKVNSVIQCSAADTVRSSRLLEDSPQSADTASQAHLKGRGS